MYGVAGSPPIGLAWNIDRCTPRPVRSLPSPRLLNSRNTGAQLSWALWRGRGCLPAVCIPVEAQDDVLVRRKGRWCEGGQTERVAHLARVVGAAPARPLGGEATGHDPFGE